MSNDVNNTTNQPDIECPVCGAHKFGHEEFCEKCREYKENVTALRRAQARRRMFGDFWCD